MILPATRTDNIKYAVRDIVVLANEVAKSGMEMLYLNIGDPNQYDFKTPDHIVEAAYKAMKENKNGYSPSSGIQPARDAIGREAERKGIKNIQDIFVTTGGSEAIEICLTALVEDGENVLTPSPGYPLYTAILAKLGAIENPYYLDESNGWQPDIEDIKSKINDRTRAIVLINPNNPTGSNCSVELLQDLLKVARDNNIVIFADEIYDKQLFDGGEHTSIASLDPDAPIITFNGLSKNYLGPGLRIGWGIVSGIQSELSEYIEAINKILRARLCANHPLQYAIQPALEGDQSHIDEMITKLTHRRDLTVEKMNSIKGISCVSPGGAFYAFPKIEIEGSDEEWVKGLIKKSGVVVVPGEGFGQVPGTKHFRIVFLPPDEILEKAYEAIGNYMADYLG
jgi:alanine-synthesizing transaminase